MEMDYIILLLYYNNHQLNKDVFFQPKAQKKGKAPEKVVHPFSRKAAYLAREEIRLDKKERLVALQIMPDLPNNSDVVIF